jgi:hypothetical protein
MALFSWFTQGVPQLEDASITRSEPAPGEDPGHEPMEMDFDFAPLSERVEDRETPSWEQTPAELDAPELGVSESAASEPLASEPPASEPLAPKLQGSERPPTLDSAPSSRVLRKIEIAVDLPQISRERRQEFAVVKDLDEQYEGKEVTSFSQTQFTLQTTRHCFSKADRIISNMEWTKEMESLRPHRSHSGVPSGTS